MLNKNVLNEWLKGKVWSIYLKEIYILDILKTKLPLASRWGHSASPSANLEHNVEVANLQFQISTWPSLPWWLLLKATAFSDQVEVGLSGQTLHFLITSQQALTQCTAQLSSPQMLSVPLATNSAVHQPRW